MTTSASTARCPVDHHALAQQKTAPVVEPTDQPLQRDRQGTWHVRGYAEARTILRSSDTKQAGFKAELLDRIPSTMSPPILYQEGKPHHQQRQQTARFFTPKAVSSNYRALMEHYVDQLINEIQQRRRVDLSTISMTLAVQVAGKVVGLTNSRIPGMDRRLNAFFSNDATEIGWHPRTIVHVLRNQLRIAAFYYLDVQPAIRARKQHAQEDVISHLVARGASGGEILTECITYGAAGMATTREFICIAAWHFLEQPTLRQRFLAADQDERQNMLQELLRVEPVVGHLLRRATADLTIESGDATTTIKAGNLIDVHIYAANADERLVGEQPRHVCPGRTLAENNVAPAVLSFGDGHHRCPGAYIALQETDMFLQRLLALDGLRIERAPSVRWSALTTGYEVRDFMLALDA